MAAGSYRHPAALPLHVALWVWGGAGRRAVQVRNPLHRLGVLTNPKTAPCYPSGYDVMVACQLPKLNARVRFPLPAPIFLRSTRDMLGPDLGRSDRSRGFRRPGGVLVEGLQGVFERLGLQDRKSGGWGKGGEVRGDLGGG